MTKKSGNDNLNNLRAANTEHAENSASPKPPNSLNPEIGKRIKHARENARVTQEQLAEYISVSSKQYISDLERGKVGASVPTIIKICNSLHISADYILFGVQPENPFSDLYRRMQDMTEEQQLQINRGLSILFDAFEKKEQK